MIPTDEIISMAQECHVPVDWRVKNLVRFANLVAARAAAIEREACAEVCDKASEAGSNTAYMIAKAIRVRGDQS